MSDSFVTQWTVAWKAPLSLGFSRQGYWSAFPHPPPGCHPDPGIKPTSLMFPALAGKFCTTSSTWETLNKYSGIQTNIWSWKANTPSEVDLPASQGNPLAYQPQGQNCFIFFFTNFFSKPSKIWLSTVISPRHASTRKVSLPFCVYIFLKFEHYPLTFCKKQRGYKWLLDGTKTHPNMETHGDHLATCITWQSKRMEITWHGLFHHVHWEQRPTQCESNLAYPNRSYRVIKFFHITCKYNVLIKK